MVWSFFVGGEGRCRGRFPHSHTSEKQCRSLRKKNIHNYYCNYEINWRHLRKPTWPDDSLHFDHWTLGLLTGECSDESSSPAPLSVYSLSPAAASWGPHSAPSAVAGASTLISVHPPASSPALTYFSNLWNTHTKQKKTGTSFCVSTWEAVHCWRHLSRENAHTSCFYNIFFLSSQTNGYWIYEAIANTKIRA